MSCLLVFSLCTSCTIFIIIIIITSSSGMAERPPELGDIKKARVNGGTDNHSLKDSHKCIRCR